MTAKKRVYFPNLNGLRFLAAFMVIVHHIEQLKGVLGLPNSYSLPFVARAGKLGVVLFFVLSGFLITYLLLVEEEQTGTIAVKHFYIRRFLRIWPLYYLIVALSFFVFPHFGPLALGDWNEAFEETFWAQAALFLFFLPNVAATFYGPVPYASQAWSVGVEEQFYLIWPLLMRRSANKIRLLYGVIFGYLGLKFGLLAVNKIVGGNLSLVYMYGVLELCAIDCMAIGGIMAVTLYRGGRHLQFLFQKRVQVVLYVLLLGLIGAGVYIPRLHFEFYAVLFGVAIVNLAANSDTIVSLENSLFDYLGKISYGLYMFHPLAIVISLKALSHLGVRNNVVDYVACVGLTIVFSSLSYWGFEKYFISKKARFSQIISGDQARSGPEASSQR